MMKLNEFISVLNGVDVLVINFSNNEIIYKGRSSGIKLNAKMFKNYDIAEVFSGDKDDYYDLEIDVTEGVKND